MSKRKKKRRKIKNKGSQTKEPLTEKEQVRCIEVAKEMGEFEYQTFLVLLDTGMHPSVICEEEYELQMWGGFIKWTRPKNKQKIILPVSDRIKDWVEEWIMREDKPTTRQYYFKMVKSIGDRAGVEGVSPMTLRHTFAVNRLNQGYTLGELQDMMGVRDLRVLAHYTIYSRKLIEERHRGKGW